MPFLQMFILAVVQGVTEFIPVSSSGHLVLAKHFIGFDTGDGPLVEIVLHGGSLLAIIYYYRRRLSALAGGLARSEKAARRDALLVIAGCVPVVMVYALGYRFIDGSFERPALAAAALLLTGVLVSSARFAGKSTATLTLGRSVAIGLAQVFSLLPGISRSGTTIASARHLGLSGEQAASFSFLMAVPLLAGGCLVGAIRLIQGVDTGTATATCMIFGFLVSALVSLAAIHVLICALRKDVFWLFGLYALAAGAVSLAALVWI